MATIKLFSRVALPGVTLLVLLTGCPSVCPDVTYSFAVTTSFSPEQDSLRVGDTLYVTSSFPTKLAAGTSGQLIDYSNAVIGGTIFMDEIPTDRSVPLGNAVSNFQIVAQEGQIYTDTSLPSPDRVKQIKYQQQGSMYGFRFGFIPQRKGQFCLTISDGYSTGKADDRCDNASFSVGLTNADQHLHYLATYLGGTTVSPYSARGGYCFKVY